MAHTQIYIYICKYRYSIFDPLQASIHCMRQINTSWHINAISDGQRRRRGIRCNRWSRQEWDTLALADHPVQVSAAWVPGWRKEGRGGSKHKEYNADSVKTPYLERFSQFPEVEILYFSRLQNRKKYSSFTWSNNLIQTVNRSTYWGLHPWWNHHGQKLSVCPVTGTLGFPMRKCEVQILQKL